MGKGKKDELWDDSALINAFNDAISKYKKMHKVRLADGQENAGKPDAQENGGRLDETDDGYKVLSNSGGDTKGDVNASIAKETSCLDSDEPPENNVGSSIDQYVHQESVGYQNSQTTEDYNQLVNKYYELENQKQKILQQLNQFGDWSYGSGLTDSVSQGTEAFTSQAHPTVPSSFCPYGCQSWVAPCASVPCYFSGEAFLGNSCNAPEQVATAKNLTPPGESEVVKIATVAAERALSCLKEQACSNPDASANEGKGKQMRSSCHSEKSASSETDLTVVLNAWYSAGFYTGKYLTEQSSSRHGQG